MYNDNIENEVHEELQVDDGPENVRKYGQKQNKKKNVNLKVIHFLLFFSLLLLIFFCFSVCLDRYSIYQQKKSDLSKKEYTDFQDTFEKFRNGGYYDIFLYEDEDEDYYSDGEFERVSNLIKNIIEILKNIIDLLIEIFSNHIDESLKQCYDLYNFLQALLDNCNQEYNSTKVKIEKE